MDEQGVMERSWALNLTKWSIFASTPLVKRTKKIAKEILSHVQAVRIGVITVDGGETINSNCLGNTAGSKSTNEREEVKEECVVVR